MGLLTMYLMLIGQSGGHGGFVVMNFCMRPGHIIVGFSFGHNLNEAHRWGHLGLLKVGVLPVVRGREKYF